MKRPPLTLREARSTDHVLVVALAGDLVLTNADELRRAVEAAVETGRSRVVLDLAGVTHVDTPGLALLVQLQDRCRQAGGELVLAGLPGSFDDIVEVLRIGERIRRTASVESALEPPER